MGEKENFPNRSLRLITSDFIFRRNIGRPKKIFISNNYNLWDGTLFISIFLCFKKALIIIKNKDDEIFDSGYLSSKYTRMNFRLYNNYQVITLPVVIETLGWTADGYIFVKSKGLLPQWLPV